MREESDMGKTEPSFTPGEVQSIPCLSVFVEFGDVVVGWDSRPCWGPPE